MEFVEFVLGLPQLRTLVNMQDSDGETALHLAVGKCNPKMVTALLLHQDIDFTVINNLADPATWNLSSAATNAKTLNWVRIFSVRCQLTQTSTKIK
jgi:ankyrin repeat protein